MGVQDRASIVQNTETAAAHVLNIDFMLMEKVTDGGQDVFPIRSINVHRVGYTSGGLIVGITACAGYVHIILMVQIVE